VRVPVENRYAFTDFGELQFTWNIKGHNGKLTPHLAPGARGELEIPVPLGTAEGDELSLRVTAASGTVVNESVIHLGQKIAAPLPRPVSGVPRWSDDGQKIVIQGKGFTAVFDRAKGDFDPTDPRHRCAVNSFPSIQISRYDFGDLNGPNSPPYAVFPDAKTRHVESAEVKEETSGLTLTVHEHYEGFAGFTSWTMDKDGRGVIACDYTYSGKTMDTREAGIRLLLKGACDELKWRRWSEWGLFPQESISRTEGTARAHRDRKWGEPRWNQRPGWPWSQDETGLGTADFRSIKYNIYEATLVAPYGSGFSAYANGDAHFRAALAPGGVAAHLLWRCPLGQVPLKPKDCLQGEFVVQLTR
jgi:hypothetical protein